MKIIAGDVGIPDLGLSSNDKKILTDNVNIIFHSAATLDFADTLKQTVDVNLLGTRRMIELAKQCKKLNVFVHVSSAYVNSYKLKANEVYIKKKKKCKTFYAKLNLIGKLQINYRRKYIR